jgi:5-methylcytosine-specific restriction endonuclease McrA
MRRNKDLDKISNQRKVDQLGMPFGTAMNRLRKRVLFHLLLRLGETKCFHCGKGIKSETELSLEHKIAWLGNNTSLFWDLDNIAFSHLRCNVGAGNRSKPRGGGQNKKIGAYGTAWCAKHKMFLLRERFAKNRRNWNGLESYCRDCRRLMR